MNRIDKAYFTLDEIEERWRLPHRDLVYLAENGLLRVSVRVFGVHVETGHYEEAEEGRWSRVACERLFARGLEDLRERDAFRLFRDGRAAVTGFAAAEPAYRDLVEPTPSLEVRLEDLVVRREERDRVESRHGLVRAGAAGEPPFRQAGDFTEVRLNGLAFNLGPLQSRVVKLLHRAAVAGEPWCTGKVVLAQAGSASTRMSDVFKSQPHWRRLIESDRRGRYRLFLAVRRSPSEGP
jgi:hypothetical protein